MDYIFNDSAVHDWYNLQEDRRFTVHKGKELKIEEVNTLCPESAKSALSKIAELIRFLDKKQTKDSGPEKPQPLIISFGKVAGTQYDIVGLLQTLYLSMSGKRQGTAYEELYEIVQILEKSTCYLSDYLVPDSLGKPTTGELEELEFSDYNQSLIRIREEFAQGNYSALEELIGLAKERAALQATLFKMANPGSTQVDFLNEQTHFKDFEKRDDLIARFPLYDFTTWHPDVTKATIDTYRNVLGVKGNIYLSAGSADKKSYFSSVTAALLQNRQDIVTGTLKEEDIAYLNNQHEIISNLLEQLTPRH